MELKPGFYADSANRLIEVVEVAQTQEVPVTHWVLFWRFASETELRAMSRIPTSILRPVRLPGNLRCPNY